MADSKITALTAISTVDPTADPLVIVDVSDTSMAASGTTKKSTINQLLGAGGTATLASASITGDLTVDTSTLKVDSTNNRVGIGTASPAHALDVTSSATTVIRSLASASNQAYVSVAGNGGVVGTSSFDIIQDGSSNAFIYNRANAYLVFGTNNVERYRIDSTGISTWAVAGTTAMTLNSTGLGLGGVPSGVNRFVVLNGVNQDLTLDTSGTLLVGRTSALASERLHVEGSVTSFVSRISNTSATTPSGLFVRYTAAAPNGVGDPFVRCDDNAATRFELRSNGGLGNYSANNVNLSDARTKTDIKPLTSYWNKIKALELVTFKYKDQTHDDDNIGLISQQVESVAPEFVSNDGFGETPADGVPLKAIYTTDLYHAAIKALQEAMTRIEVLEAKLA